MTRPPLRLLHCADLHFTHTTREASLAVIARLRAAAEENQVDYMLIAGDLFDSTNQPNELVDDLAEELSTIRVPIVAIPGNHDIRYSERDANAFGRLFDVLNSPQITTFIEAEGAAVTLADGRLDIWGRGMPEHTPENDPLEGLPQMGVNGSWHVAIAHGFLMDRPNGRSSPIIPARHREALATFDYVALGHRHLATHRPFDGTLFTDSGSGSSTAGRGTFAIVELDDEVISTIHELHS